MKVTIEIHCDDEIDILTHLSVIRTQIKSEIKKQGGDLKMQAQLQDSNCYGEHTIEILPE